MTMTLSTYIIASNEEAKIGDCIDSCLGVSDEIIVVHNDCTDRTVKIAREKGAICFEKKWTGYKSQKSFALSKCSYDWTLNLDADEILSDQLRESIDEFLRQAKSNCDAVSFSRQSYFLNTWIRHGDWYPDVITRLSRKGRCEWVGSSVHEFLKVNGHTKKLNGKIYHYSYDNLNDLVLKTLKYTDLYKELQTTNDQKITAFTIIFRSIWRFFRCYILKRGFLDGWPGLVIAVNSAFYVFLKYCKLRIGNRSGQMTDENNNNN